MKIRFNKIYASLLFFLIAAHSILASAGTIPNGEQCSSGQVHVYEKSAELKIEMDSQCRSNYCYPGPTVNGATKTEWYCIAKEKNCAWPGSSGEYYGTWRNYAGGSNNVKCLNPGKGGRARFSD